MILGCVVLPSAVVDTQESRELDVELASLLGQAGFTGSVGQSLEQRLGRQIDPVLANVGRLLWFDTAGGLHNDNTCGGCHSPASGFGDSQSIAIGVQSNGLVGSRRAGPSEPAPHAVRGQQCVLSEADVERPLLVAVGRSVRQLAGLSLPCTRGDDEVPPFDPHVTHLLVAQAHIPPTELVEVAGFTGTAGAIGSVFDQFDDGLGSPVPPPDASGFRKDPIRAAVVARLNASAEYRVLFGQVFPDVAQGSPIDFTMFARAIAEFEFTLVFADAPIDRFAWDIGRR